EAIAARSIHPCQRLAALAIARPEPALVIGRPYCIRAFRQRPWAVSTGTPAPLARQHKIMPLQDFARRRHRRPGDSGMALPELDHELLRTPGGVCELLSHDQLDHMVRRRPPVHQRSSRPVEKAHHTLRLVARKPFVAGLARYPELFA